MLHPPAAVHELQGISSIPALFAWTFNRAACGLAGPDIARLAQDTPGNVELLGWVEPGRLSELQRFAQALADREMRRRYDLRNAQRRRLAKILEPVPWPGARACFVVACILDRTFSCMRDDVQRGAVPRADRAGPVSIPFFDGIDNRPTPLGQMTSIAVCQRWMRTLRVVPDLSRLDGFGSFPAPRAVILPPRTRQRLQDAVDGDRLRVGAVTWRRHERSDIDIVRLDGRFAVLGIKTSPPDGLLEGIVEETARRGAHILVFPELCLRAEDLDRLRRCLAARDARFPTLVVAGLAHAPAFGGASHVNEAVVLAADGKELWRHEKVEPFTHRQHGMEDIVPRQSPEYLFADTPIGRIVVNICRDLRSDVPMVLNRALGTSLLLVPAWSRELAFVLEEARLLGARQNAVVVSVNPVRGTSEDDAYLKDVVAAYAPIRGERREPVPQRALDGVSGATPTLVLLTFGRGSSHGQLDMELPAGSAA